MKKPNLNRLLIAAVKLAIKREQQQWDDFFDYMTMNKKPRHFKYSYGMVYDWCEKRWGKKFVDLEYEMRTNRSNTHYRS